MLACAMCFGPNTVGDVGAGMNPGLLLLLAAPYTVAGIFGAIVYMSYRRIKAARLQGGANEGDVTLGSDEPGTGGDDMI